MYGNSDNYGFRVAAVYGIAALTFATPMTLIALLSELSPPAPPPALTTVATDAPVSALGEAIGIAIVALLPVPVLAVFALLMRDFGGVRSIWALPAVLGTLLITGCFQLLFIADAKGMTL
jgi:hypothetical protein